MAGEYQGGNISSLGPYVEAINLFKHVCSCGKRVEVVGLKTIVQCSCGQIMERVVSGFEEVRIAKGLKQAEAAKIIGIHKSYLCKIEKRLAKPTPIILKKLEALYGR